MNIGTDCVIGEATDQFGFVTNGLGIGTLDVVTIGINLSAVDSKHDHTLAVNLGTGNFGQSVVDQSQTRIAAAATTDPELGRHVAKDAGVAETATRRQISDVGNGLIDYRYRDLVDPSLDVTIAGTKRSCGDADCRFINPLIGAVGQSQRGIAGGRIRGGRSQISESRNRVGHGDRE